ncbi:MAG: CDP-alcohol phosphatidyltransferase family protein [Actinomycetales bacterium]|nr:CDP-alcohol phosphatidyltransferase family protein [Actinomycetales bacterium]
MTTSRPSVAEVRTVGQPESIMGRVNAEHWAGRLYMRHLSPYLTRLLVPTSVTADAVTWSMIPVGLAAAAVLTLPGWIPALLAVLLVQTQLLLDCADGELARWRRRTGGPMGVYVDRIAHFTTDASLAVAVGIRADGGWGSIGGWTTLGLVAAVLALMIKSETQLVHVARHQVGLPKLDDTGERTASGRVLSLRRLVDLVPVHRTLLAIEASLLALVAALVDVGLGSPAATQVLVAVQVATGVIVVTGHLFMIVKSDRLR